MMQLFGAPTDYKNLETLKWWFVTSCFTEVQIQSDTGVKFLGYTREYTNEIKQTCADPNKSVRGNKNSHTTQNAMLTG